MMRMRPFFSYLGSKWSLAKHYPEPLYDSVVEPFAGSAGYSLLHYQRQVILYDSNPVIEGVWRYLLKVKPSEIMRLPVNIDSVEQIRGPQECKWLVGFWFGRCYKGPSNRRNNWNRKYDMPGSFWSSVIRERIAQQVLYIRHWRFASAQENCGKRRRTWFIDPPYQIHGGSYFGYATLNYSNLAQYVRGLPGQVITCEGEGADWLPFKPFRMARTSKNARLLEMVHYQLNGVERKIDG